MFPLVLLGALVLGPLAALSIESRIIKRRKASEHRKYVEALIAQKKEEEQRKQDLISTLLKGN